MRYLTFFILLALFFACKSEPKLPIFGKEAIKTANGYDTIIKTVVPFEFIDQKGAVINNATFQNKIYVADFFFTSCPSICPVMTKQMLRIHETYIDNEKIMLLSHTIDPVRDSVQKLDNYANKINVLTNQKWHFVTGNKEELFAMAGSYMIVAFADDEIPGGFEHSGYFILVDGKQQIRGYYDGTLEEEVTKLIADIEILLNEE